MRLISFSVCKETIAVLEDLLVKALNGRLRGIALCYWTLDGHRRVLLTGAFRAEPTHALSAADLIKVSAAHQLDLFA